MIFVLLMCQGPQIILIYSGTDFEPCFLFTLDFQGRTIQGHNIKPLMFARLLLTLQSLKPTFFSFELERHIQSHFAAHIFTLRIDRYYTNPLNFHSPYDLGLTNTCYLEAFHWILYEAFKWILFCFILLLSRTSSSQDQNYRKYLKEKKKDHKGSKHLFFVSVF